jgi:hypothetical protein
MLSQVPVPEQVATLVNRQQVCPTSLSIGDEWQNQSIESIEEMFP